MLTTEGDLPPFSLSNVAAQLLRLPGPRHGRRTTGPFGLLFPHRILTPRRLQLYLGRQHLNGRPQTLTKKENKGYSGPGDSRPRAGR